MASSTSSTESQIRSEIERLTGYVVRLSQSMIRGEYLTTATIKQHKELQNQQTPWNETGRYVHYYHGPGPTRSNKYVNPNYQPPNKYVRPGVNTGPVIASTPATAIVEAGPESGTPVPQISQPPILIPGQKKEVVLGGVAFESSGRSLVRKDCELFVCMPSLSVLFNVLYIVPKSVSTMKPTTTTKPTSSGRKPGHVPAGRAFKLKARRGRNMTLNNSKRPYQCVVGS